MYQSSQASGASEVADEGAQNSLSQSSQASGASEVADEGAQNSLSLVCLVPGPLRGAAAPRPPLIRPLEPPQTTP